MKKKPKLAVTNPFLLSLFNRGWEDPEWGKSPIGQVTIATAIHELANQLEDKKTKKQIQEVTAVAITQAGEKLVA
jgi:hypothetical protein